MINRKNYFAEVEKIGAKNLPQELGNIHQVIATATGYGQNWKIIDEDKDFKRISELAFQKLESLDAELSGIKNEKDPPEVIKAKQDASMYYLHDTPLLERMLRMEMDAEAAQGLTPEIKIRKTELEKLIRQYKKEEAMKKPKERLRFSEEAKFIRRFLELNGKTKTENEILELIEALQYAIKKKKIRKNSLYADEIDFIQHNLIKTYKSMGKSILIRFNDNTLAMMEKALNLFEEKNKGLPEKFIKDATGKEDLTAEELSGISDNKVICSTDFVKLKFDKIGFKDKWLEFIGDPSPGFTALIFGPPKMGKSYLCIDLAGYLARNHGKVLYVAKEEKLDDTLQIKFNDTKVAHPNLDIVGTMPDDLSPYQFVFLDSITKLRLIPEDLEALENKYPKISFFYISQVRKDGKVKGSNSFSHDVDVIIEVPEIGKAYQQGRFNPASEMNTFEETKKEEEHSELSGAEDKKTSDQTNSFSAEQQIKRLPDYYKGISISEGTLKPHELITRFVRFLDSVKKETRIEAELSQIEKQLYKYPDEKDQAEILNDRIIKLLDDIAPSGTFFKSHEGDGAAFGFWDVEEEGSLNGGKKKKPPIQKNNIEIEAELSIPLGEVLAYTWVSSVSELTSEAATDKMLTLAKSTAKSIIQKKRLGITTNAVLFKNIDSDRPSHGMVYFDIKLEGPVAELKKIAGEDKEFYYDWQITVSRQPKKSGSKKSNFRDDGPDDLNPRYLFSTIPSELLSQIVKGQMDLYYLARLEMANRGLDREGKWIGFPASRKMHGIDDHDLSGTDVPEKSAA